LDLKKKQKIEDILSPDKDYTDQNDTYCFLPGDRNPQNTAGKGLLGNIQETIKRNGALYYLLLNTFAPVIPGRKFMGHLKSLLNSYDRGAVILNLGSGPHLIRGCDDVINVDLYAFDEVDIVSDASSLPIKDNCVDLILNIAMMEHAEAPGKIIGEMHRVLKKDGQFLCYMPFTAPFHAAPYDFHRWTIEGAKRDFSLFEYTEIGIGAGPTSGMLWTLQEWLAILFSLGSRTLHDMIFLALMIVTAPVKLLDLLLVHFPNAEKIASGFFVCGKK